MNFKPARVILPALSLLALAACADKSEEMSFATATDVQSLSTRVSGLEADVRSAQQSAQQAQQAAEQAQAAAQRIEDLYRQGQRK